MELEKFSVLMSVYIKERPEYLEQSLASNLVNQSLIPDEFVLICDGELTPELEEVIEKYQALFPEIFKVYRKENGGLGRALNFGLPKCTYNLVARADSDDICKEHRYATQVRFMSEHPEYGMTSSWVDEFVNTPGDYQMKRVVPETPEEVLRYAKSRCPVNHPSVMFRKAEVLAAGGYQTKYFPEDFFLWIKMLQNGCKVYNIQESLVWFRFSLDTFKRRGGWSYAVDEAMTQINVYKMGFIGIPTLIKNIAIRFTTRLLPNSIRSWIYTRLLRK